MDASPLFTRMPKSQLFKAELTRPRKEMDDNTAMMRVLLEQMKMGPALTWDKQSAPVEISADPAVPPRSPRMPKRVPRFVFKHEPENDGLPPPAKACKTDISSSPTTSSILWISPTSVCDAMPAVSSHSREVLAATWRSGSPAAARVQQVPFARAGSRSCLSEMDTLSNKR